MTKQNGGNNTEVQTAQDARALIEADRLERQQRAAQKIRDILQEEHVILVPVMIMRGNQVTHEFEIQAVDN